MNELILPKKLICGYFDCSIFGELKQSPERTRTLFELEYFLEDGKYTYTNGKEYPVKKGYIRVGSPGELSYSLLPFKTKYVKFSAEGMLAETLEALPRYFRSHRPFETERMLDEIISLYRTAEENEIMLAGRLMTFIASVIEDSKASSDENEAVPKAQKYIEAHLSEPIRLNDIASAVNLSPSYFHSLFKEKSGLTPRDYLEERRLQRAGELLLGTSLPISKIAEQCGFCNQQYMSLAFKKRFSVTPSSYRRGMERNYMI